MLVRTRPFNRVSPGLPAFDRAFDRAFDQLRFTTTSRSPVVDAAWKDGSLVLTADLPGTPADAVDVAVAGRTLTLSAKTDTLSWERSLRLGAALDPEQVSATYADGRLTVTVGAVVAAQPRRIEISATPAPEVAADEVQPGNGTNDNG